MIVVDASAILGLLLREDPVEHLSERILDPAESLHAPHLLDLEIAQVLRRYWLGGEISTERGAEALSDFGELRIVRYPHEPLVKRVWGLRANVTAYDAAYLALAEALGAPLLTRDVRLAKSPGHGVRVEVI